MDVLINSDLLFHGGLVTESLSQALCGLLDACRDQGHRVVLPETAMLEWDRQQAGQVARARTDLITAYTTLERYGIEFARQDPDSVISIPNLMRLIEGRGADVVIERPTQEDFEDAHRRACLHEPPSPPDAKSDEMRDLVIWMIALRVARARGGALLVSRDQVHAHARGSDEANAAGLLRAASIEDALEVLLVETPGGRLFSRFLSSSWEALRESGLPLGDNPRLVRVLGAAFVQGEDGAPELAEAEVTIASDGAPEIGAHVEVRALPGERQRVLVTAVRAGDEDLHPQVAESSSLMSGGGVDDIGERIAGLRRLVEGD